MPVSGYFDTIFAAGGDLNTIPDATQPGGTVSYEQGFPVLYSTPVASGGLNVPRTAINQVLNDITTAMQAYQQFGTPPFITSAMNGGMPFSYALGARVLWTDGHVYMSADASNTTTPASSPASWLIDDPSDAALRNIGLQLITATGNYVPTTGMKAVLAFLTAGGGGGGGGEDTTFSGGAGGAAGSTAIGLFLAATIGSSKSVTIGGGGTPGTHGNTGTTGGTGGTSSLGTLMSSPGGSGGGFGTATNAATPAPASAAPSGGLLNIPGSGSISGFGASSPNSFAFGGAGAPSFWGGNGNGGNNVSGGGGNGFMGSGGGGGTGNNNGGSGGPGLLLLIEFLNQ
jgi:hypothetical protein